MSAIKYTVKSLFTENPDVKLVNVFLRHFMGFFSAKS